MKRFLAVLLAGTTLLSTSVFAGDMRYVCNNDEAEVTADAIFKDGIVYLPVAQVCKALGYKVIEKESNNSVTAEVKTKPGYFSVFLGKSKGRMNGMDIKLSKTPFKENDVIYVTAGLIEEQLGVSVKYDSSKNTIYIDSNGEGKITSTVGQAPVAKPAATSSSTGNSSTSSSSSSGNYTAYARNRNISDFGSVTGRTGEKQSEYNYIYDNVSRADVNKYCEVLKSGGFKEASSNTSQTPDGLYTIMAKQFNRDKSGVIVTTVEGNTTISVSIQFGPY